MDASRQPRSPSLQPPCASSKISGSRTKPTSRPGHHCSSSHLSQTGSNPVSRNRRLLHLDLPRPPRPCAHPRQDPLASAGPTRPLRWQYSPARPRQLRVQLLRKIPDHFRLMTTGNVLTTRSPNRPSGCCRTTLSEIQYVFNTTSLRRERAAPWSAVDGTRPPRF